MTIINHELRQSRLSLTVWTAAIGFLIAVCVFLFPEMKGEMDSISDLFASMGGFTKAFGMDKVSFGTLLGFYAVECGNILGLGGAFFAALAAVSSLSKEEQGHTAEFLLTHPVSRSRVITEKLLAVVLQLLILNAAVFCISLASMALIGEEIPCVCCIWPISFCSWSWQASASASPPSSAGGAWAPAWEWPL